MDGLMQKIIQVIMMVIAIALLGAMTYSVIRYFKNKDAEDKKMDKFLGIMYGIDMTYLGLVYCLIDSYFKNPGKNTNEIVIHSIALLQVLIGFLVFNLMISKKSNYKK